MRKLNDQNIEQSITQYDQVKCSKLKSNLAMNLISKSFSICLDKETFNFQNEKILKLNIFIRLLKNSSNYLLVLTKMLRFKAKSDNS